MKVEIDNIVFGHLGNGYTVYDRSRNEHGDYLNIAHISVTREVVFYKSIDNRSKEYILNQAAMLDPTSKEILLPIADAEAYNKKVSELRKEHGLAVIISKRCNNFEATGVDASILFDLLGVLWNRRKLIRRVGETTEDVFKFHELNLRDVLKVLKSTVAKVVVDHGSYIKVYESENQTV